jgi:type IV secretion system protein VirB6
MNTWQVFQYTFDQIETPLLTSVGATVSALISYAAAPLQIALVIYIALTGVLIIRGHANEAVGGLLGRVVKLCLVAWFITNGSVYTTWVQDFFLTVLPNDVTQAVANVNGGGTIGANSFDTIWIKAFQAGLQVWKNCGDFDFGEEGVVILFWLASMLACIVTFVIWFVSHVVLALFISIGPLLLGLVLFPATRAVFERWIGSMLSCVILQVFTVIMLTLVTQVEGQIVAQIAGYTGTNAYQQIQMLFCAVIFFAFSALIAFQLPGAATALSGGLHFHTGAIARATFGAASSRASMLAGRAKQASQQVDTAVGAGARALYRRIRPPTGGSLSSSSASRA